MRAARYRRDGHDDRRREHVVCLGMRPDGGGSCRGGAPRRPVGGATATSTSSSRARSSLRLLSERGISTDTLSADELVEAARPTGEPQLWAMAIAAGARLLSDQGRLSEAKALLVELAEPTEIRLDPYYVTALPELVRTALALGEPELAARLLEGAEGRTPLAADALTVCRAQLAEAGGDYSEAASALCRGGRALAGLRERPRARLRPARPGPLPGRARPARGAGAAAPGARAVRVDGIRPALAETDALLEQTTAAAS